MTLRIRRLERGDDRTGFASGNDDLDRFFHRFAGQNQFRLHIGSTYVAMEAGTVPGFATVSPSQIERKAVPGGLARRLPGYPVPVLRLARLAVDRRHRNRGIGAALLRHVLLVAFRMRDEVGCAGVVVDALPDAAGFYRRLGFEAIDVIEGRLPDRGGQVPMFLEIGALQAP